MRFAKKISKQTFLFGRTSGLSTALSTLFFTQGKKFSSDTASSAAVGSFRFRFDVAVEGACLGMVIASRLRDYA